jgi:hypothetical protein
MATKRLLLFIVLWCVLPLAAYDALVSLAPVPVEVAASMWSQNRIRAERYLRADKLTAVLVGSSLTQRLPDEAFGPGTYNLALASNGPATGIEIIRRSARRPRMIVIETNIINAAPDETFINELFDEPLLTLRSWFAALRQENRPLNLILNLIRGPSKKNNERLMAKKADPDIVKRMIGTFRKDYDQPLPADALRDPLSLIKTDVDALARDGVKIAFLEMPINPVLRDSARMSSLRAALKSVFPPEDYLWLDLDAIGPVETEDGLHLVYRDAVKVARALQTQITGYAGFRGDADASTVHAEGPGS